MWKGLGGGGGGGPKFYLKILTFFSCGIRYYKHFFLKDSFRKA